MNNSKRSRSRIGQVPFLGTSDPTGQVSVTLPPFWQAAGPHAATSFFAIRFIGGCCAFLNVGLIVFLRPNLPNHPPQASPHNPSSSLPQSSGKLHGHDPTLGLPVLERHQC